MNISNFKTVAAIFLVMICGCLKAQAAFSFFAGGQSLSALTANYSSAENIGFWNESVVAPVGFFAYCNDVDVVNSLGGIHNAGNDGLLFYMSEDCSRYAVVAVAKKSHMPLQIITHEVNIKFDFCYLSDGVIEVVGEDEHGVSLAARLQCDLERVEQQVKGKNFSSSLLAAVYTTALIAKSGLDGIAGLSDIVVDFERMVNLPYYPMRSCPVQPIVDSSTGLYRYMSLITNWASEQLIDVAQNILLWTGESTFKVGGSSATLAGAVCCLSESYKTLGTFGIVVDKSPDNLTVGKAEFVLQADSTDGNHGFEVDARGLQKRTTYYYRTYYSFTGNDHGTLRFKFPPHDAQVGYGPTKSFATQDNILYVDVVMCMDATGSMGNVISMVKSNALSFYDQFKARCDKNDIILSGLTVQVVQFRDINADGPNALLRSSTFQLPGQRSSFSSYVNAIKATGGGDTPESGLEALHMAITKDDWGPDDGYHRQVIVLWTDAPYIDGSGRSRYSTAQVKALWNGMPTGRRMILFAPNGKSSETYSASWQNMDSWKNVVHLTDLTRGFNNMGSVLDDIIGELTGRASSSKSPSVAAPQQIQIKEFRQN